MRNQGLMVNSLLHILLFSILCFTSLLCHTTKVPYSDHCSSFLPVLESPPRADALSSFPFGRTRKAYFNGGNRFFNRKSSTYSNRLTFLLENVHAIDTKGVLKIEAYLMLPSPYVYDLERNFVNKLLHRMAPGMGGGIIKFWLEGYWSEYSGKLCMVGFTHMQQVGAPDLKAVLRLENIRKSSTITSLIRGSLQSLSSVKGSEYFEPLSILMLPSSMTNYTYTLLSSKFEDRTPNGGGVTRSIPLNSLPRSSLCMRPWWPPRGFYLEYSTGCDMAKNCSPLGGVADSLPRFMFIRGAGCFDMDQRFQVLLKFSNVSSEGFSWYFDPSTTLIGEGSWDDEKLIISACQFLDAKKSMASARIGDCLTRLSLRFPAVLSIRENSNIVGQIWTTKSVNDSGFFEMVMIRSSENYLVRVAGQKYQYTEIERARKSCPRVQLTKSNSGQYPDGNSLDMKFDLSVRTSKERIARGFAIPFTVGDRFYEQHSDMVSPATFWRADSMVHESNNEINLVCISYKIGITMAPGMKLGKSTSVYAASSIVDNKLEILAEGIYDASTGVLCMVGCRNLELNSQKDTMDCEVLLNFQFPSIEGKLNHIEGRIESTRSKSDPLYFDLLKVFSTSYTTSKASIYVWRMGLEMAVALISSTMACFFVGLQLFHVKRHPQVLPFISLLMLLMLTLGNVILLGVEFKPFFVQRGDWKNPFIGRFGSLEVNQAHTGLAQMVAILLQCHLLRLVFTARNSDENQRSLWLAEKANFKVLIPFLAAGILIVFLSTREQGFDLELYARMVLDGFLLPQILLNFLRGSKENTLSCSFYIGITFLHLLPQVYKFNASDIPSGVEFLLQIGGVFLAELVYLQQRFGSDLPARRRLRRRVNRETSVIGG